MTSSLDRSRACHGPSTIDSSNPRSAPRRLRRTQPTWQDRCEQATVHSVRSGGPGWLIDERVSGTHGFEARPSAQVHRPRS